MKLILGFSLFIVALGSVVASAQTPTPNAPTDGMELLRGASRHYAEAKSYRIETIEESTSSNELERNWSKTLLEAAETPGGKFHYDGQSGWGSASQISNGEKIWTFDLGARIYTEKSASTAVTNSVVGIVESQTVFAAKSLRDRLAKLADHYVSATRLPDDSVDVSGKILDCYVVRVTLADMKRKENEAYEETIWIDKRRNVFVKRHYNGRMQLTAGTVRSSRNFDGVVIYEINDLNTPVPELLFSFIPPADAKLVDEFPNPTQNNGAPSLKGQMLPDLQLVTSKGETISRESLRGKAVVLDLWATWCAPCVSGLEQLAAINKEGRAKGLTLITIDQDEDAATAAAMLSKKNYDWVNVHDAGEIAKALGGTNGIPRTLIVNREGKVVYDRTADIDAELRKAIAALGPEFASLAPKTQPLPCPTQVSEKTRK